MNTKLTNGELWYDTEGNILHAHGGHMLKWGGQLVLVWGKPHGKQICKCIQVRRFTELDLLQSRPDH